MASIEHHDHDPERQDVPHPSAGTLPVAVAVLSLSSIVTFNGFRGATLKLPVVLITALGCDGCMVPVLTLPLPVVVALLFQWLVFGTCAAVVMRAEIVVMRVTPWYGCMRHST